MSTGADQPTTSAESASRDPTKGPAQPTQQGQTSERATDSERVSESGAERTEQSASVFSGLWGWGASAIGSLQKQGAALAETCMKDLAEFGGQIREDTSKALSALPSDAAAVGTRVRSTVDGVLSQLGAATGITLANTDPAPTRSAVRSGMEATLRGEGARRTQAEKFAEWAKGFDLNSKTEEIAGLLSRNEALRELHTSLVPQVVSYREFWENHYFEQHCAREQLEVRQKILQSVGTAPEDEEEDMGWGEDEEDAETEQEKQKEAAPAQ